jgi:hypothetical protein
MLDLMALLRSFLCLLGLSLILAGLGFAVHAANLSGTRLINVMRDPGRKRWINAGLIAFCLGMLGSSHSAIEGVGWGLLAMLFLALSIGARSYAKRIGDD